jgi:hypothetical protein
MDAMSRAQGQEARLRRAKKATVMLFLPAFAGFSSESGKNRPGKPRFSLSKGLAQAG